MVRFLFLIGLVACGSPWEPVDQMDLEASYTDCADGSACVVVELGCCDSCNGGAAVAVRSDLQQAALDAYGESCNGPTMCTEMGCPPLTAECVDDVCTLLAGEF